MPVFKSVFGYYIKYNKRCKNINSLKEKKIILNFCSFKEFIFRENLKEQKLRYN